MYKVVARLQGMPNEFVDWFRDAKDGLGARLAWQAEARAQDVPQSLIDTAELTVFEEETDGLHKRLLDSQN